jgi:hypothetical protein
MAGAPVNRGKGWAFLNVSFVFVVAISVFIALFPLPAKAANCFKRETRRQ